MTGIVKVLSFAYLLMFAGLGASPQASTKEESADGEYTVEMIREGNYIRFVFQFANVKQYSHLTIEKNQMAEGQFRQCAYVDLKGAGPFEGKDKYPFSKYEDSYYRIRTVTADQIERVYPPIRLPAATALSSGE